MEPKLIPIFTPDGDPYQIPEENLQAALDQGARIATPDEIKFERLKQEKSGVWGTAQGFAAGEANALTFGAFDKLAEMADPEKAMELRAAQAAHPIASGVGTGVGTVTSLFNPVLKGVSAAGKGVGGAAEVYTGSSIAGKVAQFGTEGALLSVPKAAVELVGNPEEAAETMLFGTALGAGLGGAGGLAGALPSFLREAGSKASTLASKVSLPSGLNTGAAGEKVKETLKSWEVGQGGRMLGINKAYLKKMGADRAEELVEWADKQGLFKLSNDASDRLAQAKEMKEKLGDAIRGVFKEIDDTGKRFVDVPSMLEKMKKLPVPQGELLAPERMAYQKAFADVESMVLTKRGQPKMLSFASLQKVKSHLGNYAYGDFSQVRPAKDLVMSMERIVDDTIDESLTWAERSIPGRRELWANAKRNWKNYKDIEGPLKNLEAGEMGNQFVRPTDAITGAAGVASGGLTGGAKYYLGSVLRHQYGGQANYQLLKRVNGYLEGRDLDIGKAVDSFFTKLKPSSTISVTIPEVPETVAPGALAGLEDLIPERHGNKAAYIEKLNESLAAISANPENTADILSRYTPELGKASPEVANHFRVKLLEAASYLQQHIPRSDEPLNPFGPSKFTPTDQAVSAFERRLKVALNPYSVVSDLGQGGLSPEAVQTLKELYPFFYQKLSASILEKAAEKKGSIPFSVRMQLSMLLGGHTDPVMRPDRVSVLQQSFSLQEQQPAAKKVNFSNDLSTPVGKISSK